MLLSLRSVMNLRERNPVSTSHIPKIPDNTELDPSWNVCDLTPPRGGQRSRWKKRLVLDSGVDPLADLPWMVPRWVTAESVTGCFPHP